MSQDISSQLTVERLKELIRYCPESGQFFWIKPRSGVSIGPAGYLAQVGYIYISIDGKKYLAHRVAWFYMTGEWPSDQVDHINCIRTDNRWANLRDVAPGINNQNRIKTRSDNHSSKLTGVSRNRGRWRARIHLDGKEYHLGTFDTIEEARAVYLEAKEQMHEGYVDHQGK